VAHDRSGILKLVAVAGHERTAQYLKGDGNGYANLLGDALDVGASEK